MKFLDILEFITKLPTYYRVMLLKKYVRGLSKGVATEIEVSALDIRPSRFRVILMRGSREVELQRESFPAQFIDRYEKDPEIQETLQELVIRAERKLAIPKDLRYAAILMALEEHDQHHRDEMMSSLLLREAYPPYARGDLMDDADVTALFEQRLIQLYRGDETDVLLKDPKGGRAFVPSDSDVRFRRVRGGESMAVGILPKGREWLERWREHYFEVLAVKYKVMLSGVTHEFERELKAIRETIHESRDLSSHFEIVPYNGLEAKPPSGVLVGDSVEAALNCDIYLGLFGESYGSIGQDGISLEEREYRAAIEDIRRIKAIWIFRPSNPGRVEQGLRKLLRELNDPSMGQSQFTFGDPQELKLSVQRALRRYLVLRENWQVPSRGS